MDDAGEMSRKGGHEKEGRAYARPPATYDRALVEVGPGTSGGELLRRYWQPFALSRELDNDLPLPIRLLGENLVAFRDGDGKAGLMYPRCMHRGADLVYGKLEPKGLRCPYHGWLFDTQGHLLDTPCELDPTSTRLHRIIRQPWYPVVERHGIAFTYMGPPEKEPLLPRFPAVLEDLADDEQVVAGGGSKLPTDHRGMMNTGQMDYNWMQFFENFMDPLHLSALHSTINGPQFTDEIGTNPSPCRFGPSPDGTGATWIGHWRSEKVRTLKQAVFQTIVPNIKLSGAFVSGVGVLMWIVPRDDTSFRTFTLARSRKGPPPPMPKQAIYEPEWGPGANKRPYLDWSFEDFQRWQTDYSTQKGLGEINLQSDEHLTSADAGVALLRRAFLRQADRVAKGEDPIGATPGQAHVYDIVAGGCDLDFETGAFVKGVQRLTLADYN